MAMATRQVAVPARKGTRSASAKPRLRVIPGGFGGVAAAPRTGLRAPGAANPPRSTRGAAVAAPSRNRTGPSRRAAAKPLSIPIGRPTIAFAIAVVATAAAFVFGLVLLNIFSAQSSFTLAEIQSSTLRQEAEYRRMRFEVAKAESPEKIAEVAAQLGLTPPAEQEYLLGPVDSGGSHLLAGQP